MTDEKKPKTVTVEALQMHTYEGTTYEIGDTYEIDEQYADSVVAQGKAARVDRAEQAKAAKKAAEEAKKAADKPAEKPAKP